MIGSEKQDNQILKRKIRMDYRCQSCGGVHTLQKRIRSKITGKEVWVCNECNVIQPE